MQVTRPRCPAHPDATVRSAADHGRRSWCCLRCGARLGEAPVSTTPGWEELVAELGEERARVKALGLEQGYRMAAEVADSSADPINLTESDAERVIAALAAPATPAPALVALWERHQHTPAEPVSSEPPAPARIAITHQSSCKGTPCSCAARLRTLSRTAHELAATWLATYSNFEGYHEDDREEVRGHLQRIVARLKKGNVC